MTPKRLRSSSVTNATLSGASAWQMNTVCPSSGRVPSASILFTSSVSACFMPRALETAVSLPSASQCITGLIESTVPTMALVAFSRPPRRRCPKSSTVNQ